MNATSEKEFIIDYHQFYPINSDVEIVSKLYPEMYPFVKNYYYINMIQNIICSEKYLLSVFEIFLNILLVIR